MMRMTVLLSVLVFGLTTQAMPLGGIKGASIAAAELHDQAVEQDLDFISDFDPQADVDEEFINEVYGSAENFDLLHEEEEELSWENFVEEPKVFLAHHTQKFKRAKLNYPIFLQVSIARQTLTVYKDFRKWAVWNASTGKKGHWTPQYSGGHIKRLKGRTYSSGRYPHGGQCTVGGVYYGNMSWAMFYRGGYAIHGTCAENKLGRPASKGCTRISRRNAQVLQGLVKSYGLSNTWVVVR